MITVEEGIALLEKQEEEFQFIHFSRLDAGFQEAADAY
jgi:hypothetical protein